VPHRFLDGACPLGDGTDTLAVAGGEVLVGVDALLQAVELGLERCDATLRAGGLDESLSAERGRDKRDDQHESGREPELAVGAADPRPSNLGRPALL
jgi:hypothetical protein